MLPLTFANKKKPLQILCLGAHCDDIEIGCGGTILRLLEQDPALKVTVIVFSSNPLRVSEHGNSIRRFIGDSNSSVVHEFRDGFFPNAWKEIKETFEQLKQQAAFDIIFTHYRNDLHQDHRIVSELTWNTFRNHMILEYEIPKYDGDFGSPNFFFPLSEEVCRKKVRLIMESYRSQAGKGWFTEDTFKAVLRIRGVEANSPTGFAEGFYVRKAVC